MARRNRDAAIAAEEAETEAAVAARVGARRRELGLSQADVAVALGVGLQQFHKYERGASGIPLGRLRRLARVLGVTATWLLDGASDSLGAPPAAGPDPLGAVDPAGRAEAAGLLRRIADALSPAADTGGTAPGRTAGPGRRRRRGATWDPADIKAAAGSQARGRAGLAGKPHP